MIRDVQMFYFYYQKYRKSNFATNRLLFLAWEDPENEEAIPDYDDEDSEPKMVLRTYEAIQALSFEI